MVQSSEFVVRRFLAYSAERIAIREDERLESRKSNSENGIAVGVVVDGEVYSARIVIIEGGRIDRIVSVGGCVYRICVAGTVTQSRTLPIAQIIHRKALSIRIKIRYARQPINVIVSIFIIRIGCAMVKGFTVDIVFIGYVGVSELNRA